MIGRQAAIFHPPKINRSRYSGRRKIGGAETARPWSPGLRLLSPDGWVGARNPPIKKAKPRRYIVGVLE